MRGGVNGEESPDSRWMSYLELAEARRIATASAIKLVQRHGWRRQKDNHGTVRALVPPEWSIPMRYRAPQPDDDLSSAITALQMTVAMLRERAEAAERVAENEREHAERAEVARRAEYWRADFLRERIDLLRSELAAATVAIELARAEAAAAVQFAETLRQAEQEWRALGRLERIRRAWRGD